MGDGDAVRTLGDGAWGRTMGYDNASLSADQRAVELLIVGGGITGAGAALDAAARGLDVGLLEARDLASGTSSKSSKLIHGGLRYLEMGDLRLVREALRERELLLTRLAPHLVSPVPFLWPFRHRLWERPYLGAGLILYDTLGGARSLPRHRHLSRRSLRAVAPGLRRCGVFGGVRFFDAAEDDARMVLAVARTAAAHGARIATRARVLRLLWRRSRVDGVEVLDEESGARLEIRAGHVALAVGAWTDELRASVGAPSTGGSPSRSASGSEGCTPAPARFTTQLRPSKGVHITVARDRIALRTGLLSRTEKSVLFVIPMGDRWLIGDTDTPWELGPDHPVASGADVDYLLAKANELLAEPLAREDVIGVFAGLRPLVGPAGTVDTTRLSRRHALEAPLPGLTTIAGGKYTTYRVMAADLIDAATRGRPAVGPSRTSSLPILGAERLAQARARRDDLARRADLPPAQVDRLLGRYGDRVVELVALIERSPELARPLEHGDGHLAVEVVYACTHEGALHLEDVLERRTRLAIAARDRGLGAAPHAASLMASVLGWEPDRVRSEVDGWRRRIAAQRAAEAERDDTAALAAYREALHAALPEAHGALPQAPGARPEGHGGR